MSVAPATDRTGWRDLRWGNSCLVHTTGHWCYPCRAGRADHTEPHTCACGAVEFRQPVHICDHPTPANLTNFADLAEVWHCSSCGAWWSELGTRGHYRPY